MTPSPLPDQADGGHERVWARAPAEPAVSEATRLLCAGVHLDGQYRDTVLDELYVHEERFTAPSFGFDAARVLAHALHARRVELGWALGILALWILAVPLTGGLFLLLVMPCALVAVAPWIRGRSARPRLFRVVAAFAVRWYGRIWLLLALLLFAALAVFGLFGDEDEGEFDPVGGASPWSMFTSGGSAESIPAAPAMAWLTLVLFALTTVAVALQRGQFARMMTGPLAPHNFPSMATDPAEAAQGPRARQRQAIIRHEQHSPLAVYDAADPFRGAGDAFQTWTLAVELVPREGCEPRPVSNRTILERIRPLVEDLRIPSAHEADPRIAGAVRDRLRELRIDECVFLPAEGIGNRHGAPYDPAGFEAHRAAAVEEGGEARRHFLRIRVGGWEEQLVVTVFVRVHTQGGMLMLEVAPHALMPVHPRFREADRLAHRYVNNNAVGRVAWALAHTPRAPLWCAVTLGRHLISQWELLTGGHRGALPDGPALSIREYGSDTEASLFHEMDIMRYLRSIQDRIAGGVTLALREAGWRTEGFEQKIVHVSGGVYIDSANNSAFGFGSHSTATTNNNTTNTTKGGPRGGATGPASTGGNTTGAGNGSG
ncbi:hypothetical protein [Streptomyces sp. CAU 1734]|uniref:hypothetical protein n=1 Tax=Streptomyces sp. CAU 1734 TaxID=3140360 RepID=UPI0032600DD1